MTRHRESGRDRGAGGEEIMILSHAMEMGDHSFTEKGASKRPSPLTRDHQRPVTEMGLH